MGKTGAQTHLLPHRLTPVPVINTQSAHFVYQIQGPIVTKLGDLYSALPILIIPSLVFFGSGNLRAALITMGFIATLTPFATLKFLGLLR